MCHGSAKRIMVRMAAACQRASNELADLLPCNVDAWHAILEDIITKIKGLRKHLFFCLEKRVVSSIYFPRFDDPYLIVKTLIVNPKTHLLVLILQSKHGGEMMPGESCRRKYGKETMEKTAEEKSWRRNHGGEMMDDKSGKRRHGGQTIRRGVMDKKS